MGGHGGLNILPQKKWNVYNFDNREKVKRDEEAAAREEQAKRQKARQAELEFKLDLLREKKGRAKRRRIEEGAEGGGPVEPLEGVINEGAIVVRESKDGAAERPQHINLFAEYEARALEEEAQNKGQLRGQGSRKGEERDLGIGSKSRAEGSRKERNAGRGVEKVDGKETGEPVNENYGLGHGLLDKNGKKPWYTYKSFMVDRASTKHGKRHRPDERLETSGTFAFEMDGFV
jgi:hypothetical protein